MRKKSILVVVNGARESVLARRAAGLFSGFSEFDLAYVYRKKNRLFALAFFTLKILSARPDLVYLIDTSIPGAFAAVFCRIIANQRFAVDTGDLAYELAKSKGKIGIIGLTLIFWSEHLALKVSEFIVTRGTYHKDLLETKYAKPVILIRDAVWVGNNPDRSPANLRAALGLADKFVIGMVGSINYAPKYKICYGWDLIAALGLIEPDIPVHALMIGDGDGLDFIKRCAAVTGVAEKVHFAGRIAHEDLPGYLNCFDIAVSTQTNNGVGRVRTTAKLVEYMAAKRFVLCSDVGEARLLLPEIMRIPYDGVRDDEYPKRLAARIRLLYHNRDIVAQGGQRNYETARALLDYGMASHTLCVFISEFLLHGSKLGYSL